MTFDEGLNPLYFYSLCHLTKALKFKKFLLAIYLNFSPGQFIHQHPALSDCVLPSAGRNYPTDLAGCAFIRKFEKRRTYLSSSFTISIMFHAIVNEMFAPFPFSCGRKTCAFYDDS